MRGLISGWVTGRVREFREWFEGYLHDVGVPSFAAALLTLLTLGGALSALFGVTAVRSFAVIAVFLAAAAVAIIVVRSARTHSAKANAYRAMFEDLLDVAFEHMANSWRIEEWREVEDMVQYFRVRLGAGRPQPDRVRRKVRFRITSVVDGDHVDVRLPVVHHWRRDGRLELLMAFTTPWVRDDVVCLQVDVAWPAKWAPLLVQGQPDQFVSHFSRPIENMQHKLIFPKDCRVRHEVIGLRRERDDFDVEVNSSDGRSWLHLIVRNVDASRRVGVRLDLGDDMTPAD
ncbi:hypothetical protein Lesp02_45580 [Lentzea sp. NBRC 105346]|uniref:hypothetical protein n=1 Tax=Lentzea sp. NBRC 105346 TaxID=3032205 RepID=UPI0024A600F1|nr:hypothetical protein [Lentzea sp. NBRC 105346]GLZ32370.1 hypothetical protein Lesp02_45580 [Lentzea sp. NBRC 105346]